MNEFFREIYSGKRLKVKYWFVIYFKNMIDDILSFFFDIFKKIW